MTFANRPASALHSFREALPQKLSTGWSTKAPWRLTCWAQTTAGKAWSGLTVNHHKVRLGPNMDWMPEAAQKHFHAVIGFQRPLQRGAVGETLAAQLPRLDRECRKKHDTGDY